ncbi:MAG: GNAT family N-acetyltransferase [Oscillospiraceae bacterium]|nr:GNAT family N-acetyltransferase [Oscillospiraceae bacterium]
MIETENLFLDKARFSDWEAMYHNVWSRPESAEYMAWSLTTGEEEAKIRMMKTIAFQKEHDTYLVYEKASGRAIGFAGVERVGPCVYQETGICLGPDYVRKGFGKQILQGLMEYCKETFGAKEFLYMAREENSASNHLAKSLGFSLVSSEVQVSGKDGCPHCFLQYRREL